MSNDWILLFKGLCTGFFYTFISISGMILVSHYIIGGSAKRGMIASLGIVSVQVIWSAIASLILLGSFKGLHSDSRSYAIIGSIVLFIMAIKIYRGRQNYTQEDNLSQNPLVIYGAGFLIALAIPMRILGYTAIFAALGINDHTPTLWEAVIPVVGVLLGSLLWWVIFTLSIHHTKKMISPKTLQQFHKYAAFILIVFSLIGLLQVYF